MLSLPAPITGSSILLTRSIQKWTQRSEPHHPRSTSRTKKLRSAQIPSPVSARSHRAPTAWMWRGKYLGAAPSSVGPRATSESHQPRAPGTPLGYVGAPAPRHVTVQAFACIIDDHTMLYTVLSLFILTSRLFFVCREIVYLDQRRPYYWYGT
jgi:hypothetical protein